MEVNPVEQIDVLPGLFCISTILIRYFLKAKDIVLLANIVPPQKQVDLR